MRDTGRVAYEQKMELKLQYRLIFSSPDETRSPNVFYEPFLATDTFGPNLEGIVSRPKYPGWISAPFTHLSKLRVVSLRTRGSFPTCPLGVNEYVLDLDKTGSTVDADLTCLLFARYLERMC